MSAAKLTEAQRFALLRFENAACVIADETSWSGTTSDMVQIRRSDFNELREALAEYRAALKGGES